MLNHIEKFKVTILHIDRDSNYWPIADLSRNTFWIDNSQWRNGLKSYWRGQKERSCHQDHQDSVSRGNSTLCSISTCNYSQDSLDHCPMPIKTDQKFVIDCNADQSALRGISDQCLNFDRYWSALIGIEQWSRESCIVLKVRWYQTDHMFLNCGSPPGVDDGWHTELQC